MSRRVTQHKGRTHKNGAVFSAEHPDRNFTMGKDSHIDPTLSHKNVYWMNPELGIETRTFAEFEQEFYKRYFARHVIATNEKHEKTRHYERMIDSEKLRRSPRTAVEDTLLYFGDKKNPLPDDVFDALVSEFVEWHKQTFPQCVILDYAIHRDEPNSATHCELRSVFCAVHEDGYLYPNQTKALEQMGIQNNGQKRDNAKKEYTKMCREKQAEILVAHGYAVELAPKHGKGGQTLEEFKRDRAIEERKEQEKFIIHPEEKEKIESQIRPNRFNKDEVVMPKELAEKLVTSSLERDKYMMEYMKASYVDKEKIDQEKMGLQLQLSREKEAHDRLKERFRDLNTCITEFTQTTKGMYEKFKDFVAQFKDRKEKARQQFQKEQERIKQQNQDHGHHHKR